MRTIRLDGRRMGSIDEAHQYLKRRLHFPDYYGVNLDALWDLLSTQNGEIRIRLSNPDALRQKLGEYGEALIRTLLEAGDANPHVRVEIEEPVPGARGPAD